MGPRQKSDPCGKGDKSRSRETVRKLLQLLRWERRVTQTRGGSYRGRIPGGTVPTEKSRAAGSRPLSWVPRPGTISLWLLHPSHGVRERVSWGSWEDPERKKLHVEQGLEPPLTAPVSLLYWVSCSRSWFVSQLTLPFSIPKADPEPPSRAPCGLQVTEA